MALEWQSKGTVVTVGSEIKTKLYPDGASGTYVVCTVKHADGALKGKTYFAQRTLKNKDGVTKPNVTVGQEVQLYNSLSDDNNTIFSSISAGAQVDDIAELLALANAGKAQEIAEQAMS